MRKVLLKLALVATPWLGGCAGTSMLPPIEPPSRWSFDRSVVEEGAKLAAIGNCARCHTAPNGKAYAGGHPLKTPFGIIYGTNITPDPDTGIGRWSEGAFVRAMRDGIDREGRHLYPAFPYEHFTRLTDADLHALYAYMMTREPVRAATPPNTLRFPYGNRGLIGVWKALFFEPEPFFEDRAHGSLWNRGAYLVQGLAHCGACHTPRNALGGEQRRRDLAGGDVEGWHAPALNEESPAPVPWTAEHLYAYLRTGIDHLHAIAAGPMQPVVRDLSGASPDDVRAIANYIAARIGKPPVVEQSQGVEALQWAHQQAPYDKSAAQSLRRGATVYQHACGTCHDQGRGASSGAALELVHASATTLPTSANLVRITLEGIHPPDGESGRWMPGFAGALADEQVHDVVAYMRYRFGKKPPWSDVDRQIAKAKADARQ